LSTLGTSNRTDRSGGTRKGDVPERTASPQTRALIALAAGKRESAIVVAMTVASVVVLQLVDTQIYTEPVAIDPWLYTALMTNFDFTYQWFHATYYASRLPAVIPGVFLNSFLTAEHAYVVYHVVFFLLGGVFLY
jgi:hypothetical protein